MYERLLLCSPTRCKQGFDFPQLQALQSEMKIKKGEITKSSPIEDTKMQTYLTKGICALPLVQTLLCQE